MSFYIIPMTTKETRDGKLVRMTDILSQAQNQGVNLEAYFDNSTVNKDFNDKNNPGNPEPDDIVQNVYYLNETAKETLDKAGETLNISGTIEEVPEGLGRYF